MSKISIESKPVALGYDHLYLVFENDLGQEFVIRGGPENDNPADFGEIVTEVYVPIEQSEDRRGTDSLTNRGNRVLNLEGRNAKDVWEIMTQQATNIGAASLNYNAFFSAQNSNSTIASVLNSVGIDVTLNLPTNTTASDLPGLENLLEFDTTLNGTAANDIIKGYKGDDILSGMGGNDTIIATKGEDIINGGAGDDLVDYSAFSDKIKIDLITGVAEIEDGLLGFFNTTQQLTNIENIIGGSNNDLIKGNGSSNNLDGRDGEDTIEGGGGDDILSGGKGDDILDGGNGFDTYQIAQSGDGVDTITDTDGQGQIVITNGTNQSPFSIIGNATPVNRGTGGIQLYEIPNNNIKLEYNSNSKVLNVIDWNGKSANDKIIINDFDNGELGINLALTSLSFIRDFVTGSTQDTQVVFDIERLGDTTFPITIFVDGEVTRSNAVFNDFNYTLPAGDSPQLIISASVSEVFGDVAFNFEIDAINPDSSVVNIIDGTAAGILFGDRVDNRGGQTFGDPHLITFDNVSYDFQAAGDFILTRATSGPDYEVQARFSAFSSAVSVTTAMATKVDGIAVSIQIDGDTGDLLIDGSSASITDGDSIAVGGGSISRNGRKIEIDHGNGDKTSVDVFSSFMNVTPSPSLARIPGSLEGLLGDADGNPGDDFQLADGTVLSTPLPISTLYGSYAASWLVADSESILPGARELFDAPDRIITIDSLPQSLRQAAEAAVAAAGITNPILREAAILDFALTGNVEFIEAAKLTNDIFDPIIDTVAVDPINNPVVILTANQIELDEANPAHQTATLTVSRGSTTGDLTINYNVIGVGAYPANTDDFSGNTSGTVVINDGEDTATFTVGIVDDLLDEESEQFDVAIALDGTQASAYELLVSSVRMTILDDDDGPVLNEVIGTTSSDYLVGTGNADIIHSLGGSYDRSFGGLGADIFAFGSEALNGIRERDVIMDYEVGIDAILLEDGASVGSIRQTSTGAVIFLEGDLDAIYVQGEGVLPGNLTFLPESLLLT